MASWKPRHSLNILSFFHIPQTHGIILLSLIPPCPSPSHQFQRPEEEVHQFSRAGVLDMLLQLCLGVGSTSR